MWYWHTKNPVSLINFLHGSQKGSTLSLLNSIAPLKINSHHLIDVATQWTDRHFIDLSLTTAAWASGGSEHKKRNVGSSAREGGLIFSSLKHAQKTHAHKCDCSLVLFCMSVTHPCRHQFGTVAAGLYEAMRDKAAVILKSLSMFSWMPYFRTEAPLNYASVWPSPIFQTGWKIKNNQMHCHRWQIILLLLKDCHPWNIFIVISSLSVNYCSFKQAIPLW